MAGFGKGSWGAAKGGAGKGKGAASAWTSAAWDSSDWWGDGGEWEGHHDDWETASWSGLAHPKGNKGSKGAGSKSKGKSKMNKKGKGKGILSKKGGGAGKGSGQHIHAVKYEDTLHLKLLRPYPGDAGTMFYRWSGSTGDSDAVQPATLASWASHENCEAYKRLGNWLSMTAASFNEGAKWVGKCVGRVGWERVP